MIKKGLSDLRLFFHLKKHPGGKDLDNDKEVKVAVYKLLREQVAEFSADGIQNLLLRHGKCLKQVNYV